MTADPIALVLAGGLGTRMAPSHPGMPKPLVEVGGVSLLELAFRRLIAAGVADVRVAVRHGAADVAAHAEELASLGSVRLEILAEDEPLGTIGAAWELRGEHRTVLALNGDLLSGIDLAAFLARHRERRADLSIATHDEHRRLKLGEVLVGPDDRVIDYLEKPVKTYRISSGTYLLEPSVLALLERREWLGFPTLAQRAIRAGLHVLEDFHAEPWLDVNDADDLALARDMLARDPAAFGVALDRIRGR